MARVLLVDDDVELLDCVEAWLRREHEVIVASGFPEAVALLMAGLAFDVVVTDYEMPPFCGDDLLALVAVRVPGAYRILHTGTPRGLLDGAGATAHHVVVKGGDLHELSEVIRECMPRPVG